MKTVRMKTEDEFIQEFGPTWKNSKFQINDIDVCNFAYTIAPSQLAGQHLDLEDHEYQYYLENDVIRWYDEKLSVGLIYITKGMIADSLKVSLTKETIYSKVKNLFKVSTVPQVTISEEVIRSRMNIVKLKY